MVLSDFKTVGWVVGGGEAKEWGSGSQETCIFLCYARWFYDSFSNALAVCLTSMNLHYCSHVELSSGKLPTKLCIQVNISNDFLLSEKDPWSVHSTCFQ